MDKKPVVPQFVAEWYEKNKDCLEWNLYSLCVDFYRRELQDDLFDWFKYGGNKPIETLVKMKLFGYEVEKEKLYTVELPNTYNEHFVLRKNNEGKVCIAFYYVDWWKDYKCTWLTEAEIKKDFDWAWQFAEEVEV